MEALIPIRSHGGFSLIELVIVLLILGIGAAGLTTLFGNSSGLLTTNETQQRTAQYAQACAERVLAIRRNSSSGFSDTSLAVGNGTACDGLPLDAGYVRTVAVTTLAVPPCPTGIGCKQVAIEVSNGALKAPVTLMLAN